MQFVVLQIDETITIINQTIRLSFILLCLSLKELDKDPAVAGSIKLFWYYTMKNQFWTRMLVVNIKNLELRWLWSLVFDTVIINQQLIIYVAVTVILLQVQQITVSSVWSHTNQ